MKLLLIIYGLFATYKWYSNYMGLMAMIRYAFDKGLDMPTDDEIRKYAEEELKSLLRTKKK